MAVRRREDSAPDAWWVDFRVGGKRHRLTVRAADEGEALKMEMLLREKARRASPRAASSVAFNQSRYQERWTRLLDNARSRAYQRGEPFGLTKRDLERLVARARNRCEVTGLPFSWKWARAQRRRPFAPSLDRIDRRLGYTFSNVRLVCVAVNIAMNEWGEETFAALASAYIERRNGHSNGNVTGIGVNENSREAVALPA